MADFCHQVPFPLKHPKTHSPASLCQTRPVSKHTTQRPCLSEKQKSANQHSWSWFSSKICSWIQVAKLVPCSSISSAVVFSKQTWSWAGPPPSLCTPSSGGSELLAFGSPLSYSRPRGFSPFSFSPPSFKCSACTSSMISYPVPPVCVSICHFASSPVSFIFCWHPFLIRAKVPSNA